MSEWVATITDDPSDGPSSGPPKGWSRKGLNIQVAVVWSGAWDQAIWDRITSMATTRKVRTLVVLTQTAHQQAWVNALPGIPIIEIKP